MCDSTIENDNPALKQAALEQFADKITSWNVLANRPVGYTFKADPFMCNIEATKLDPGYPANGYDGAYEQGSEFEAFVVISVEGTYFKKTGIGDSYGDVTWDGPLKKVSVKEKIVKVFE
jgi:hypothetical protein